MFSNIRPTALVHSSNFGGMETFLLDFSPKFCHFRNIRSVGRVFKLNNQQKKKVKTRIPLTYTTGISGKRFQYFDNILKEIRRFSIYWES